jgi:hypothetical protein
MRWLVAYSALAAYLRTGFGFSPARWMPACRMASPSLLLTAGATELIR